MSDNSGSGTFGSLAQGTRSTELDARPGEPPPGGMGGEGDGASTRRT